jgi:hypothetical protein
MMTDLEKAENEKAWASMTLADLHPPEWPLYLAYFGIVTADPLGFRLDHGIGHPGFAGDDWLNDNYLPAALEMGAALGHSEVRDRSVCLSRPPCRVLERRG